MPYHLLPFLTTCRDLLLTQSSSSRLWQVMSIIASSFVLFLLVVLPTMPKYSSIKTFHITFFQHPELLCTCRDTTDCSVIFSDEPNGKLNENCLADMYTAAVSSIGASCCTFIQDKTCDGLILLLMLIIFTNPNCTLKAALDYCVNTKMIYFHYVFQTDIFYFPPSFIGCNFNKVLMMNPVIITMIISLFNIQQLLDKQCMSGWTLNCYTNDNF